MAQNKRQICDLLIEDNIITIENMKEALEIQKKEGGQVGSILIKMGVLKPKTLVKYLDIQIEMLKNKQDQ